MARFSAVLVILVCIFAAPAAAAPGSITGHVDDLDGDALVGICVTASVTNSPFGDQIVTTDDQGDYAINGLAPGPYKVYFLDQRPACVSGGDFYIPQWFNGATDMNAATVVNVADGVTNSGIDATMAEPQAIVGRTTDPGGQPIDRICVSVHPYNTSDPYGPPAGFAQTDEDGYYVIQLPVGQYKVQFFDQGGPCTIGQYVEQWYRDKGDFGSADTVQVLAGRTTFDVDAVMYEPTTLGGHVQDEAGQPLLGICVVANNQTTLGTGVVPPFARTDAAGNYEMENIPPGDWVVQFYDGGFPCNVGKYVLQFFNGKPTPELADPVHVARGGHVTGINATMKLFVAPVTVATIPPPQPPPAPAVVKCRVPALRGVTLGRAKRLLKAKHCRLGKVTRKRVSRKFVGRVISSKPRAHSLRANGTKVALVLGKRR